MLSCRTGLPVLQGCMLLSAFAAAASFAVPAAAIQHTQDAVRMLCKARCLSGVCLAIITHCSSSEPPAANVTSAAAVVLLVVLLQVADLMAAELRWGGSRRRAEVRNAMAYLATFQPPAGAAAAAK